MWSQRVKMRPAIGGEKTVLSPQSSALENAQKQCFCSQKLDLRHFSRKCRENLIIRTLRIKFRNKSGFEDCPQLVPACKEESTVKISCYRLTKDAMLSFMQFARKGTFIQKLQKQTDMGLICKEASNV